MVEWKTIESVMGASQKDIQAAIKVAQADLDATRGEVVKTKSFLLNHKLVLAALVVWLVAGIFLLVHVL